MFSEKDLRFYSKILFIIWAALPSSVPAFLLVVPPRKKSSTQAGLQ